MILCPKLKKLGLVSRHFTFSKEIEEAVYQEDWNYLDKKFKQHLEGPSKIRTYLAEMAQFTSIEHLLALRKPPDEDGIWHDDGSRTMGFSISLNLNPKLIKGGRFQLRMKGKTETLRYIIPGEFGLVTCFLTGKYGLEHRVEAVSEGKRLMLVGWCS